jgi:hypothetical protein
MTDNPTIYTLTDILNNVKKHLHSVNTTVVIDGMYQMVGTKDHNGRITGRLKSSKPSRWASCRINSSY